MISIYIVSEGLINLLTIFINITGVDLGIFMWWTMITLTGKCMPLEGALRLQFTAKATDFWHPMRGLEKRRQSMRMHQRVNGGTGTGSRKGICFWMGHTSCSRAQEHHLAMPGQLAWVQDQVHWWAQWPGLLGHLHVGRVPAVEGAS